MARPDRDKYYHQAKREGYRSRAAYKLAQLDDEADLLSPGDTVVDLGAAPGGWLQVAAERVGASGVVVGVDRQRIAPLDDVEADVETVRGDLTAEETKTEVADLVGEAGADVVLSDMAPDMTGEYSLDHARSIHLARQAFEVATVVLAPGGAFIVKVFDGPDLEPFRADLEDRFSYVRATSPAASRSSSSERYLLGVGFLTSPVEPGERLTVTIEALGREGDGIASVDGYRLFVPGTDPGETVEIEVEDVKPRFGFARKLDDA